MLSLGMGLTTVMTQPWQLVLLWGVLMGVGAGSMALVFGADRRAALVRRPTRTGHGRVLGRVGDRSADLPARRSRSSSTMSGWRSGDAAAARPWRWPWWRRCSSLLRDRPADVGPAARTARPPADVEPAPLDTELVARAAVAILRLRAASRTRAFWLLAGGFFVCGWSTNGLIGTHFVPAAHDHGMPTTTAAACSRSSACSTSSARSGPAGSPTGTTRAILLLVYYALRGVSLLVVHLLWAPTVQPPMFFFVVFYGLDWVATVPPTVALCREYFGAQRAGVMFGWVFASHMVGAGVSAWVAGTSGRPPAPTTWPGGSPARSACCAAVASWVIPRGDQLERADERDPDPALTPG